MRKVLFSVLVLLSAGHLTVAEAQQPSANMFFEGDIVRGDQQGAPGPGCVLNNQFKRLEKVVWRIRVLDQTGKPLDASGLKSLIVELPDGQKMNARFGAHPPPRVGPAVDNFWTAAWIIPASYPTGSLSYKVVATDQQGNTQSWEPFKTKTSQLAVLDGQIEINRP